MGPTIRPRFAGEVTFAGEHVNNRRCACEEKALGDDINIDDGKKG